MANRKKNAAGDFTGKKGAQLQKEHAEELAQREGEIALMNEQERKQSEEVTDLTVSGAVPGAPLEVTRQPGQPGVTTSIAADGNMTVTQDGRTHTVKTNSTAVTGTGAESPSHVPGETPTIERVRGVVDTVNQSRVADPNVGARGMTSEVQHTVPQDVGVQVADNSVVIRVNADLENVTIGQGTNYTFREGQRYRVPQHVADHLEERGLVWH